MAARRGRVVRRRSVIEIPRGHIEPVDAKVFGTNSILRAHPNIVGEEDARNFAGGVANLSQAEWCPANPSAGRTWCRQCSADVMAPLSPLVDLSKVSGESAVDELEDIPG